MTATGGEGTRAHSAPREAGRLLAGLTLILLALASTAAAVAEPDPYDLVDAGWGIDFVRAGDPGREPWYPEINGSGVCVLDYDGDGWEDLFFVNGRYANESLQEMIDPRSALYRNLEGAGFERVMGALEISSWGQGCAAGDYDRDGDPDVVITSWGGTLLYRNEGGGAFVNATDEAGIHHGSCGDDACFGASAAFLDYDKDGDLDLYVLHYLDWRPGDLTAPNARQPQCNVLWRNNGDRTFTNVTAASGTADCGKNHFALAIADVDGNGYPDIFVASDETDDTLLMNDGDGTFTDRTVHARLFDKRGGMGAAWGDYDEDGLYDLVITHFEGERFALYRQGADLVFEDRADADGLAVTDNFTGWGAEFTDYDADGHLDLVMVNGHVNVTYGRHRGYAQWNLVLRNDGAGAFENVTGDVWHPGPVAGVSRGLAVADLDRDGYLDVVVSNNANETPELYRSVRGPNNYLALRLTGSGGMDPHALGAKVAVEAGGRSMTREVVSASSFLSQSTRDLHFGLGAEARVDRVSVAWPDGTRQEFTDVLANRHLTLAPGGALVTLAERALAHAPPLVRANRVDPVRVEAEVLGAPGGVASEAWTLDGADAGSGAALERHFGTLGTRVAVYRIEAADGSWDEARVDILVENLEPEPAADVPPTADRIGAVTLDASASTDRDGAVVAWRWTVEGRAYEGAVIEHEFSTVGDVEVRLEVEDDEGATATRAFVVAVANAIPVADAGPDVEGNVASPFVLDGSASLDPDGSLVEWTWSFFDGTVASGERVERTFPMEGVYEVALVVTDDDGATATDTILVTATGKHPIARPGPDRVADRVSPLVFDGSASEDPDGEVVAWRWDLGDGATAEGAVVSHTYAALGEYAVTLTVTDSDGLSASAGLTVHVANLPPDVDAGGELAQEGLAPVTLSATGSDADGRIVAWEWDFGDGTRSRGADATHTYLALGRYVARATATDAEGLSATVEKPVWLYARPVAVAGPDRTTDRLTDLTFDGSASSDADGRVVAWRWDFGDGSGCTIRDQTGPEPGCGATAEGARVAHRFTRLGTFDVTLTVTDDDGWTGTASARVTVVNLPPVPRIDGFSLANVGQTLVWDGGASRDPDGDVVSWSWGLGGGASASGPRVTHAFDAAGASEVRLVVTDSDGASAEAALPVDVVTWLRVGVTHDRESYGVTERPRVVVAAEFANGLPAAGAEVDADLSYRLVAPAPGARPSARLATVEGATDEAGRLEFEAPPPWHPVAVLPHAQPPTALADSDLTWGEHVVAAEVAWGENSGRAAAAWHARLRLP